MKTEPLEFSQSGDRKLLCAVITCILFKLCTCIYRAWVQIREAEVNRNCVHTEQFPDIPKMFLPSHPSYQSNTYAKTKWLSKLSWIPRAVSKSNYCPVSCRAVGPGNILGGCKRWSWWTSVSQPKTKQTCRAGEGKEGKWGRMEALNAWKWPIISQPESLWALGTLWILEGGLRHRWCSTTVTAS